ncbi:MAG: hypothetical protein AVDCRST_MAG93-3157 [uncultured Chloroflexia bacterium]|uniref:Uncharacterized protein n=1 Tax=uncultured Chloroflexia bacterium TaxID=1672391 RepID=A0A6J4JK50_9CHLR|nr:MAG: hypothetical protein AVDCRST_MAG93-3157 [uncultured Chloroflexia bacterium]
MGKSGPLSYEIRVEGHLDASRAEWLGTLRLRPDFHHDRAITILSGLLADQAALHGVLNRLQAMGVVLLDATRLESQRSDT